VSVREELSIGVGALEYGVPLVEAPADAEAEDMADGDGAGEAIVIGDWGLGAGGREIVGAAEDVAAGPADESVGDAIDCDEGAGDAKEDAAEDGVGVGVGDSTVLKWAGVGVKGDRSGLCFDVCDDGDATVGDGATGVALLKGWTGLAEDAVADERGCGAFDVSGGFGVGTIVVFGVPDNAAPPVAPPPELASVVFAVTAVGDGYFPVSGLAADEETGGLPGFGSSGYGPGAGQGLRTNSKSICDPFKSFSLI
jgi:hypothetical protein